MDLVPGRPFFDCFDKVTYEQETRMATDLVNVVSSLYAITSSYCGRDLSQLLLRPDRALIIT